MALAADRQASLQGLLMGPSTSYQFEAFNPWVFPELAVGDIGRAQRHGVQAGRDLLRQRRIPAVVNVIQTGKETALEAMHDLVGAWQPVQTDVVLQFRAGARTYRVNGRPRLADPDPAKAPAGVVRVECRFLATDPLIYDDALQSDDTIFPEVTGFYGEEYPELYLDPLTYGRTLFDNEGNFDAPWNAEIVGPWTNPKVQLIDPADTPYPTIHHQLEIPVTLDDGDVLTIDSQRELITVNGVIRLDLSTIEADWFGVPPGAWALRFDGDAGTGTAEATMRSAWL